MAVAGASSQHRGQARRNRWHRQLSSGLSALCHWRSVRCLAPGLRRRRTARRVASDAPFTAILGEVPEQCVHHVQVGAIPDEPPLLSWNDKASAPKLLQVERQRWRGYVETLRDLPCGEPRRSVFDEQSVDRETRLLREGRERHQCIRRFHNREIIEHEKGCQYPKARRGCRA